jgi:hypothetical protein
MVVMRSSLKGTIVARNGTKVRTGLRDADRPVPLRYLLLVLFLLLTSVHAAFLAVLACFLVGIVEAG